MTKQDFRDFQLTPELKTTILKDQPDEENIYPTATLLERQGINLTFKDFSERQEWLQKCRAIREEIYKEEE